MPTVSDRGPRGADVTPQAISRPRCEEQLSRTEKKIGHARPATGQPTDSPLDSCGGSTVFAAAPQSSLRHDHIGRVATTPLGCARGRERYSRISAIRPRSIAYIQRLHHYSSVHGPKCPQHTSCNSTPGVSPVCAHALVPIRPSVGKSKLHGCYRSAPLSSSLAPDRARLPAFPMSLLVTCRLRRLR